MFPTTSSSILPSPSTILPHSQLFCRSPSSATASSLSMNSGCQPSFDFSTALLQLFLGQNGTNNNNLANSMLNSATLLQTLQMQILEQQQRQQREQQIVAAALQQCIQQLLFSGNANSLLLDKEVWKKKKA